MSKEYVLKKLEELNIAIENISDEQLRELIQKHFIMNTASPEFLRET
jgi:hypothetical protein